MYSSTFGADEYTENEIFGLAAVMLKLKASPQRFRIQTDGKRIIFGSIAVNESYYLTRVRVAYGCATRAQ